MLRASESGRGVLDELELFAAYVIKGLSRFSSQRHLAAQIHKSKCARLYNEDTWRNYCTLNVYARSNNYARVLRSLNLSRMKQFVTVHHIASICVAGPPGCSVEL